MNQNTLNHRLVDAAYTDDLNKVKELISEGADDNSNNNIAFRWSAKKGYLDVVKYLVKMGADIHVGNNEPLRLAADYGHLDVVKYLVKMGADVNAPNNYALKLAKRKGYAEIAEFLRLCMREDKMSKNLVKIMLKNV